MHFSKVIKLGVGAIIFLTSLHTYPQTSTNEDSNQIIKILLDQEQQRKAGLHKLTPEELIYLSQWLKENFIEISETSPVAAKEKLREITNAPMHRKIDGAFKGWQGKTEFKMTNGEIWQQRIGGKFYKKLDSPNVIISKNNMGFYVMEITEINKKIGVKLIKSDK